MNRREGGRNKIQVKIRHAHAENDACCHMVTWVQVRERLHHHLCRHSPSLAAAPPEPRSQACGRWGRSLRTSKQSKREEKASVCNNLWGLCTGYRQSNKAVALFKRMCERDILSRKGVGNCIHVVCFIFMFKMKISMRSSIRPFKMKLF